jgi:hypothetical protein
MSLYDLPGHYGRNLEIDVCHACNAIWFDESESTQLSPDGVVALFRLIHERGGTASSAGSKLSEGLRCVSCGDAMKRVNDCVKNTRFVYQACSHGHGRFTTFYNFLSEKQFVRELTRAEREKLCATVRQVRCSGCAAPVDLTQHDACSYCRAPISVFDRDAARKAIDHYLQKRHKQVPAQPPSFDRGHAPHGQGQWGTWEKPFAADLAADLLFALGCAATRGLIRPLVASSGSIVGGAALTDAAAAAATTVPLSGAFLDSLPQETLGEALTDSTVPDTLTTATEALFGTTATQDLFSSASSGLGEAVASATGSLADSTDATASVLGTSFNGIAEGAGDGVVDLVSDGIGSLITSILD